MAIAVGAVMVTAGILLRIAAPSMLGTKHTYLPSGITEYEHQHAHDAAVDVSWFLVIAGSILAAAAVHRLLAKSR